jgi:DNA-binding CsgD family transcriptional regulator
MTSMHVGAVGLRWRCMQELIEHVSENLAVISVDANGDSSLVLASGQAAKVLLSSANGDADELLHEFLKACILTINDGANAPIWKVPSGEAFKLSSVPIGSDGSGQGAASLLLIHFERESVKLPPEADHAELEAAAHARGMSKCEARVFALMARGRTNKEIAQDLDISYHTTRSHLRTIFRTLDVSNRLEARAAVVG